MRPPYGWATGTLSNSLTTVGVECVSSALAQSRQSSYNHQCVQSSILKTNRVLCVRWWQFATLLGLCNAVEYGSVLLLCFTHIDTETYGSPKGLYFPIATFFLEVQLFISQLWLNTLQSNFISSNCDFISHNSELISHNCNFISSNCIFLSQLHLHVTISSNCDS